MLMYELAAQGYEELLYLDFDAVPMTTESFAHWPVFEPSQFNRTPDRSHAHLGFGQDL